MDIGTLVINILNDLGFFNVILPFILIYSIMYGILVRTQIFGDPFDKDIAKAKTVRSIISLVSASIAFLVVGSANVVINIREIIPYIVLYILIIFMLVMTVAVFYLPSGNVNEQEYSKYRKYIVGVSIFIFAILILYAFGIISFTSSSVSSFSSSFYSFLVQNISFIAAIIILLVMIGFAYWISKPVSSSSKDGSNNQSQQK